MPIITPTPTLNEDQEAVVELLKQALEQAKEGNIDAVGVICCMKDGFASVMAGRRAGDLYMAAGEMQDRILKEVTSGNVRSARRKSPIIKLV
jgi:hypothetical protein